MAEHAAPARSSGREEAVGQVGWAIHRGAEDLGGGLSLAPTSGLADPRRLPHQLAERGSRQPSRRSCSCAGRRGGAVRSRKDFSLSPQ